MLSQFFLLLSFVSLSSSLKFLCYSPRFASSHVNYLGKLADSLIDAGHEVVLLQPILDTNVRGAGSERARVIEIPQSEMGRAFEATMNGDFMDRSWSTVESWRVLRSWNADLWVEQCNLTLNHPGLFEELRAEKFDAGFGEGQDWCMAGIFHLIGIDKFAVTDSIAYREGFYPISQMPTLPSYVPSLLGGSHDEQMTFTQRALNFFHMFIFQEFLFKSVDKFQEVFERNFPGFPTIVELLGENSLYFLNADPLVDFPRPSSARVIDLGGIAVSNGHKELNKEWSAIFDLRPKTILMSYGTFAKAYAMPEEYKNTIRETANAFPDVTFIWKYEKPEHNVTQGIANLVESTWVPQNDMLHDPRLSLFVTHCGQGSTTEANYAGVPLVVVPIIFDQVRNAFQVKRNGLGLNLDKTDLGRQKLFESTIREVLENPKYKQQATKTAAMLNDKPFTARETFVKNMEFLAKHGPLRQLDHYGKHLNFVQYYLIDVIGAVFLTLLLVTSLVVYLSVKFVRMVREVLVFKKKNG